MEKKGISLKTIILFSWPVLLILGLLIWRFSSKGENRAGKKLYQMYCSNCHMEKGEGLRNLIPSLENSSLIDQSPEKLVCLIRNGLDPENPTAQNPNIKLVMPAHPTLTANEITSLIQYLQQSWDSEKPLISFQTVENEINNCP